MISKVVFIDGCIHILARKIDVMMLGVVYCCWMVRLIIHIVYYMNSYIHIYSLKSFRRILNIIQNPTFTDIFTFPEISPILWYRTEK
jgi:hypothetical protein